MSGRFLAKPRREPSAIGLFQAKDAAGLIQWSVFCNGVDFYGNAGRFASYNRAEPSLSGFFSRKAPMISKLAARYADYSSFFVIGLLILACAVGGIYAERLKHSREQVEVARRLGYAMEFIDAFIMPAELVNPALAKGSLAASAPSPLPGAPISAQGNPGVFWTLRAAGQDPIMIESLSLFLSEGASLDLVPGGQAGPQWSGSFGGEKLSAADCAEIGSWARDQQASSALRFDDAACRASGVARFTYPYAAPRG